MVKARCRLWRGWFHVANPIPHGSRAIAVGQTIPPQKGLGQAIPLLTGLVLLADPIPYGSKDRGRGETIPLLTGMCGSPR